MTGGAYSRTSSPARWALTTPLTERAEMVKACGLEPPVMAEIVMRSPPTITSSGKSPPAVVQSGELAVVVATLIERAPEVIPLARVDPSVSARPYTTSSAYATFQGVHGMP